MIAEEIGGPTGVRFEASSESVSMTIFDRPGGEKEKSAACRVVSLLFERLLEGACEDVCISRASLNELVPSLVDRGVVLGDVAPEA